MKAPVRKTNRLIHSPHYTRILTEYNARFKEQGKVSDKKFWEEVIHPTMPQYSLGAWYQFLRNFKTNAGLIHAMAVDQLPKPDSLAEEKLQSTILDRKMATSQGLLHALNIGADTLKKLYENPELLSVKERTQLMFQAMKAEDSRMATIGRVRKDLKEEELMDKALDSGTYG